MELLLEGVQIMVYNKKNKLWSMRKPNSYDNILVNRGDFHPQSQCFMLNNQS